MRSLYIRKNKETLMRHNMLCDITLFRVLKRGILPGAILLFAINVAVSPLFSAPKAKKDAVARKELKAPAKEEKSKEKSKEKKAGAEEIKPPGSEFTGDFRPKAKEESTAWMIFKAILILGTLVGSFYFFFRYVTKKTGIHVLGEDVIKVLAVSPVGQNKYIQVIDLAGKILVVGITDGAINLITEVNDKEEIDRIRLLGSRVAPTAEGGFPELIRKQVGKVVDRIQEKSGRSSDHASVYTVEDEGELDYLKHQKDRLKNLNGNSHE